MLTAVEAALPADCAVMCAAVADYRPASVAQHKLKKSADDSEERSIELVRNPDILADLGERFAGRGRPILVGFAVETENLVESARSKLERKGASIIVANLASDSFGRDDNSAVLVEADRAEETGTITKDELSETILDRLSSLLAQVP